MEIDIRRVISEDFWIEQLRGFEPDWFAPLKSQLDNRDSTKYQLSPFPQSIDDRLKQLTQGIPTSTYVLLSTAVSILLSKYTDAKDILIITPGLLVSKETELIDNILFLRLQIPTDATIRNLLKIIQAVVNQTHKYQDYDIDALLRRFCLDGRNPDPLFDVGFSYSALNKATSFSDKVKLLFHIQESQGQHSLFITYNPGIFTETIINQMTSRLFRVLEYVLWHPDSMVAKVELLSEAEQTTLLKEFNATQAWYPHQQVIDWFEEQVERDPQAVAIVCEDQVLNYSDLNQRANQIAAYLKYHGIEKEDRVGLLLARSEYLIIAILGVLKAEAAYLPIDPELPRERIQYMVTDSECQIILSEASQQDIWASLEIYVANIKEIKVENVTNTTRNGHPHQLAYLMYTSGSTGLPKGVAIEHRSLMNYLYWASKYYFERYPQLGNTVLFTSPAFDLTVTTIFLPLLRGKKLYIYGHSSPEVLLETCFGVDSQIDTLKLTPSHIQILNYIPVTPSNIKLVIVGGEELKLNHIQLLRQRNADVEIYNEYGPTEATVGCTVAEVNVKKITIGKPIANTEIYILNQEFQLQPIGVAGEIYIGGEGLARGYWNRQELTTQRFLTNTFSEIRRIYRTGDLGRWLPGGELEYLGRKDSQVKIRGYRVELAEIEQQLLEYKQIDDVTIIAQESGETDKELVAYVVGSTTIDIADVRNYLEQKLPNYMIPTHIICLDRLPLMANGKLDRRALPKPEELKQSAPDKYEAPRSQIEVQLVQICAEVLTQKQIGIDDNFLLLGANSLKIIQIVSRVRQWLGVDLNWKEVFGNLNVRKLALIVQAKQGRHLPLVEKVALTEYYPLSETQRQFWVSVQMGAAIAYNILGAVLMEGCLDKQALQKAFSSIVNRHEVLRTTFILVDGEPKQRINQDIDFWLEERDFSQDADPDKTARLIIQEKAARSLDLENGPLFQVQLLQLTQTQHLLMINVHHIIFDGWSIKLLLQELAVLYEAYQRKQANPLQPLEFQYKDYAAWENAFLNSNQALVHQTYWHQKLKDYVRLDLPSDYPRLANQTFKGATIPLNLTSNSLQNIEKFSQQHEVSPFTIILATLKALLHRYTGKEDIIVATPVSQRTHIEWEIQIGLFLNMIVLRNTINAQDKFIDLTQKIKLTSLEAFTHQAYPFNQLVQEFDILRVPSRNPIFDVGYTWMDEIGSQMDQITLSHLKVTQIPLESEQKTSFTDLWFYFEKHADEIKGYLTYNCNLFREETVCFLKEAFIAILEQVFNHPQIEIRALNIFAEAEISNTQVSVDLNL
ncbi:MAG: amino acid adenylation domain-containing protein [Cyanomargarita calcarea GSE-NOS-MK-12-04C]|jgi:amino acid adenylation domain-containing protein|uniref:Amino acid adenylation domain-containing protein n=1 Tax=Cyanomargarita calcarea GSE-NOS-MK-12-04C TaxID=2839659 RepID=A0A951QTE2_9CYAN|nr:amino acid adenylation domain-containing protein [Cyanomargarita calcarea GSE-NOS-MK-12-04C]